MLPAGLYSMTLSTQITQKQNGYIDHYLLWFIVCCWTKLWWSWQSYLLYV